MEYTGYRQQLKCSEVELFRMIKSSMFKDELDGILHFLERTINDYNEFAKKRNKDYKENNGLSKVEYPCINLYVKRMDIDSKDKNIVNDKSVMIDLNVMYPDGTKSRELDTTNFVEMSRNKNNKGIIEEIEKAYEMKVAMPLHIMPLIEKTLYELCDVRTSISPLQGDVQGSNPSRSTN